MIETILTMALIGLLVTLLLPALGSVRHNAREVKSMADLRQHSSIMTLYAGDWQDSFPFFANPRATETIIRSNEFTIRFSFFSSHLIWPYALKDDYYAGTTIFDEIFRSPFLTDTDLFDTAYNYSCSLIASHDYWNRSTRLEGRSQFRANKMASVRYPSSKCMLSIDPWLLTRQHNLILTVENSRHNKSLIATVDGSVQRVIVGEMGSAMRAGDGGTIQILGGHQGFGRYPSGMHTVDGIYGRDVP